MAAAELFDLTGKVAIITGGAGGIGIVYARALCDAGASVVIADVEKPALDAAVDDLAGRGTVRGVVTDVSSYESVEALAGTLGIKPPPAHIVAFFPQALEEKLLEKELMYRNRKEETIQETRFRVASHTRMSGSPSPSRSTICTFEIRGRSLPRIGSPTARGTKKSDGDPFGRMARRTSCRHGSRTFHAPVHSRHMLR